MLKVKFKNSKELLKVLNTAENILKKNKNETIQEISNAHSWTMVLHGGECP